MQFFGKNNSFCKIIDWHTHFGSWRPRSEKSWICPWTVCSKTKKSESYEIPFNAQNMRSKRKVNSRYFLKFYSFSHCFKLHAWTLSMGMEEAFLYEIPWISYYRKLKMAKPGFYDYSDVVNQISQSSFLVLLTLLQRHLVYWELKAL